MNLAKPIFITSLIVLALSLTAGLFLSGSAVWAIIALLLAAFWTFAHFRDWVWANSFSFLLLFIVIVLGTYVDVENIWLIIAIFSALVAWDISYWISRRNRVQRVDHEDIMLNQHLRRLGGVLVIGLGLSLVALNLRLTLTFGWMLILGFVMILALSRVVMFLREH